MIRHNGEIDIVKKYKEMPNQIKASLWFVVCSFLQKGISALTTPIFTRLLSTEEYGQFNVFNSWYSILIVFVTLNLAAGVYTQGLIKFDKERDLFSSSLQGLTLLLTLLFSIFYLLFKNFWNSILSLNTVQITAMLIMMWTTAVFNFWASEQRTRYKYKMLVGVTLVASILKPSIGILLVTHSTDKVTARILGLVLVEIVCYTPFFFIQLCKGKHLYNFKFWKYALGFNLPLIPHYLSQSILNGADRIMIEKMVGDSEAGIYGLAYSISLIMTLFNTALMSTLSPWIYQKIKDYKANDIASISYGSLAIIAGVNLFLIALAPEIIKIFAPADYYDAIYVIPPIAMSVYFMFAYDLFAKFEFYYEKTNWIAVATIMSAIANIVLNYIFIDIFGYRAAGYTTLACYIVYASLHYLFMKKIIKENLNAIKVYDTTILLVLTLLFLLIGFSFLLLYKFFLIRYIFICFLIVVLFVYKNKLIETVKNIKNNDI